MACSLSLWALLSLLASLPPPNPDGGMTTLPGGFAYQVDDGGLTLKLPDGGTGRYAARSTARSPSLPFTWELPPKTMHEVPIDGITDVGGVPVRLRYVMVHDTAPEIGRHFLESFKRQGLYVAPGQSYDRSLTGVDPESFMTRTVMLQPNAEGYTTVILGEAQPLDAKKKLSGLPVPPGVKHALPVVFEGNTVLSFTAPAPLEKVKAFYDAELPLAGFYPKEPTLWLKPGEQLQVSLDADGQQTKVMLTLRRR